MDTVNSNFNIINECRISNSKDLKKVLDLELQPLANSLKKQFEDEEKYPLTTHIVKSLHFCSLMKL